jgi:hypothetical protein
MLKGESKHMIENIFHFLSEKLFPKFIIVTLVGTTLATSGMAGAKIIQQTMTPTKPAVISVVDDTKGLKELPTEQPTPTSQPTVPVSPVGNLKKITAPLSVTKIPTLTPHPTIAPSSTNTNQNSNACIITLFGKQYDVNTLRTTHTGGNIFTCNSDMTAIYQKQHGNDVTRMQPYLVSSNSTSGSSSTNSSTSSNSNTANSSGSHTNGTSPSPNWSQNSIPSGTTGGSQIGSRPDDHDTNDNESHPSQNTISPAPAERESE